MTRSLRGGAVLLAAVAAVSVASGGETAREACASGGPNTVKIEQPTAAPGSVVDLLDSCTTPAKFLFSSPNTAPVAVALYTEASFRKLKYVAARFRVVAPITPPVVVRYKLVSATDLAVTLPATLAPGAYAFVVHNRYTDVAWAFLKVT